MESKKPAQLKSKGRAGQGKARQGKMHVLPGDQYRTRQIMQQRFSVVEEFFLGVCGALRCAIFLPVNITPGPVAVFPNSAQ